MALGDSHIRIGASMARPPWTVIVAVALAFLLPLVQLWPDLTREVGVRSDRLPREYPGLLMLLQLIAALLIAALLARGLWRGSRFVHIVAIMWWLLVQAGFGGYNLFINRYDWSHISSFSEIGFFGGALPVAVGVLAALLLLLPASWRWTSHQRGLARP